MRWPVSLPFVQYRHDRQLKPPKKRMTTHPRSADGLRTASRSGDDLLTAEEVAALLRVTPAWVYAQTRRQRIPHLRLGRYVRYRREALETWMTEVETSSSSPAQSRPNRGLTALR
jgi:excisionase family DNA binding protein